jgi:hypothetical protein
MSQDAPPFTALTAGTATAALANASTVEALPDYAFTEASPDDKDDNFQLQALRCKRFYQLFHLANDL